MELERFFKIIYADRVHPDQTVRMRSLISACAGRTCPKATVYDGVQRYIADFDQSARMVNLITVCTGRTVFIGSMYNEGSVLYRWPWQFSADAYADHGLR